MGVDIHAYMKGHIGHEQVLEAIKQIYDPNAYIENITTKHEGPCKSHPFYVVEYYGTDGQVYTTSGYIVFRVPGEATDRWLFYYYSNANTYEMITDAIELEYSLDKERIKIDSSEKTTLMLKYVLTEGYVDTEDIMRNIMNQLGASGWIGDDATAIFDKYDQLLKFN